jgi:hypothetical protein
MSRRVAAFSIFILLAVFGLPPTLAAQGQTPSGAKKASNAAGKTLHELFAAEWDYTMQQNPQWASM